ncbi:MAG TPA: hypothetical protein VH575_05155 [Gemmataceae bacterium]|jgi:hypothetical protein
MNYLSNSEYEAYGLEPETPESWVSAASSIINAHCNRPTLWTSEFKERARLSPGRGVMRLTYLPLATPQGGTSPLVSGRARYGIPRRGEDTTLWEIASEFAIAFGLPGSWIELDVSSFDFFPDTGEVTWLPNPLGLCFDEMELVYNAGFDQVPDPVKFACAQLVRNAQAMPALNVREGALNAMHFAYFADTLLDATVRELLAPYVAQKVA